MSVAVLGNVAFQDICVPLKGKSEWGMDTLTRKMSGARSLAEAFNATLFQGQYYNFYFLQTWDWDENPNVATVTLNYKGLLTGGTPLPDAQTEVVSAVGTSSKTFTDENDGLGRFYRKDLIASTGEEPPIGSFGTSVEFTRSRYALSATMEFTYKTTETRYRYINVGEPYRAQYSATRGGETPYIERARITTSDGGVLPRTPWETFFELTPVESTKLVSFSHKQVIGTPYWEAEDVLRKILETAP